MPVLALETEGNYGYTASRVNAVDLRRHIRMMKSDGRGCESDATSP